MWIKLVRSVFLLEVLGLRSQRLPASPPSGVSALKTSREPLNSFLAIEKEIHLLYHRQKALFMTIIQYMSGFHTGLNVDVSFEQTFPFAPK
jgi:hypothetical protein